MVSFVFGASDQKCPYSLYSVYNCESSPHNDQLEGSLEYSTDKNFQVDTCEVELLRCSSCALQRNGICEPGVLREEPSRPCTEGEVKCLNGELAKMKKNGRCPPNGYLSPKYANDTCIDKNVPLPKPQCGTTKRVAISDSEACRRINVICGTDEERDKSYQHGCFVNGFGEAIVQCSSCFRTIVDPCIANPSICQQMTEDTSGLGADEVIRSTQKPCFSVSRRVFEVPWVRRLQTKQCYRGRRWFPDIWNFC